VRHPLVDDDAGVRDHPAVAAYVRNELVSSKAGWSRTIVRRQGCPVWGVMWLDKAVSITIRCRNIVGRPVGLILQGVQQPILRCNQLDKKDYSLIWLIGMKLKPLAVKHQVGCADPAIAMLADKHIC